MPRRVVRHMTSCRSLTRLLLPLTLTVTGLPAQRPDAAARSGVTRLQIEATFLGGSPEVDAVELNGRLLRPTELRRNEAGEDLGARAAMERFVLTTLQQELERRHAWLDEAQYEAAYDEYRGPYDSTPFTVKVIATRFKGYPDLATFRARWRVFECFRRTLPKDACNDAALAAEAERSRDLLVGTGVEIECWLHAATQQDDGRRDFAAAEQAAAKTLQKLRAGEAVEDPAVQFSHHGEKSPLLFNPLQNLFGEGEYTSLLREPAAAAVMRAKTGELVGPLHSPTGVLVVRVAKRTEVDRKIDVKNERTRELLRQLLEQRLFLDWVDEVFAKAVLRLPRR